MNDLQKGRPGPLGAWMLRHPFLGLLLVPVLRFVPKQWLAVAYAYDDHGAGSVDSGGAGIACAGGGESKDARIDAIPGQFIIVITGAGGDGNSRS